MSAAGASGREEAVAQLVDAAHGRGAVVLGPPGSGLSTVLRAVATHLERAGRNVRLLRLPDDRDGLLDHDEELLLVDDAHHGTPAQLHTLRERALARPVLVAARAGAASGDLGWLWRSGAVGRLDLPDLGDDIIRLIVEQRAGGAIHRTTLDGIVDRAAGRPGFAVDEIDSLLLDGRRGRHTGQVGSRLAERAADLLADLPAELAEMVETVAMAGRVPPGALAQLAIDLPALERRGLVRSVDGRDGVRIRLHPPALAAAVRATLAPARAVQLANALRAVAGSALAPDDRARVLVLAGEHVELDDLAAAARVALRDDHWAEAVNLARLAADRGPLGVLLEAELLAELGDRAAAAERYAGVVADPAAPDGLRAQAAMEHSLILMWDLARPDEAVATAEGLAAVARRSPFASAAQVHLASLTMYAGRPQDALATITAVDPATLDDASVPARMLVDTVARALVDPCSADPDALGVYVAARAEGPVERGVFIAAAELVLELQGRYADAAALVNRATAIRPAGETPASSAWSALAEARAELAIGRPGAARRAALESAALFDDVNHPSGARWATAAAMLASALAGDRATTRHATEAFDRLDDGVPFLDADVLRARAWAAHVLGNSARCATLLREAADLAVGSGAVVLEAVALHDAFRLLRAPVRPRLTKLAKRVPVPSITLRARHVELAVAGEPTALLALADDVEHAGAWLLAAEVAGDAARSAAAGGLRTVARTALGRRGRLSASCGDPVTPGLGEHRPVSLTTRERDVALLAVDGRTSREIARELAVSVRTVDNLLQRVYVKVGVHGRAELATRMTSSST